MKFDDVLEGGMLNFPHKAIMVACCTCGLSHMYVFMKDNGEPCLKVYRDNEATEAVRAGMNLREIEALIKEFQTLREQKSKKVDKER